jgi:membrane protease YdiL (CAAX protease family)
MDLTLKKPSHLFTLFLMLLTFTFIIIMPYLSFFDVISSENSIELENLSASMFFQVSILIFQLLLIIGLLVIIPVIWYYIVNNYDLQKIVKKLKLTSENIDVAFLWGIISVIIIFIIFFAIELILIALGVDPEDLGNIQDLEKYFTPATLFILVSVQPIAEEIFFRGFLLDKIESYAGQNVAIFSTAILFGLAHMSYGKIYPVLFPMIMGVILAYIVIKTRNIYASIFAHITFNITSFIIYFAFKSFQL